MNSPKVYIIMKGITVGSSCKCIRKEEIKGTCSPVEFEFPEIDFTDYGDYCW
jgi:hypothetical protein